MLEDESTSVIAFLIVILLFLCTLTAFAVHRECRGRTAVKTVSIVADKDEVLGGILLVV